MVHTRETRSPSSELKFIVNPVLALRLLEWLRTHLDRDPHGTGPFGDEYDTSSLYFDTPALDVFNGRGSSGRAKFRIRRYAPSGVLFLERKLRKPGMLVKRRSMTTLDALERLEQPEVDPGWDGAWFHRRLLLRQLHPVCQISFHRTARILATADGLARATLDTGFSAARVHGIRFTEQTGAGFLVGLAILELKFRGRAPAPFKRLIEDFALAPQTVSKFRLGMTALGHAPAGNAEIPSGEAGVSYA